MPDIRRQVLRSNVLLSVSPDGISLSEWVYDVPHRTNTERERHVSITDEYLSNNASYAASFEGPRPAPPTKHVAVVACMDARLNVYGALGLQEGEAHVISNAGGVITDGEIRSLAISQGLLGTTEIILIHHTDCGMLKFSNEEFLDSLEDKTGSRPGWDPMAFSSLEDDVKSSMTAIIESPFIPHTDALRGFIFNVASGELEEVTV